MAERQGDWVAFKGDYACTVDEIIHVYGVGEQTRIVLRCGRDFHVWESYADVMRVILETKKE